MERDVRYCTTDDGVRVAYATTGTGPPLVLLIDPLISHVELEWSVAALKQLLEPLAQRYTLVRIDLRGSGLSDRVMPGSLDEWVLDVEAAIERAGIAQFYLVGVQMATGAAVQYAARHPEQVKKLVLIDGYARLQDLLNLPAARALRAAAAVDFNIATEAMGAAAFGVGREESLSHGAFVRACVNVEHFTSQPDTSLFDASAAAETLSMPALIVRHSRLEYVTMEMARDLASRIPDARLVIMEGAWADDSQDLLERSSAFFDEGAEPVPEVGERLDGAFQTVVFTDLVGHTEMMRRLGDERGRAVLREHESITRETVRAHGGAEIKTMGDGFMVSFASVTKAMDCAIALQRAFESRDGGEPLAIRVGLNAGEPIQEEGDLWGTTVIMAARVCAAAGAGEILIPEPVRHLLAGKDFMFSDRGDFLPKGFEDAVRLHEVRWRE